MSVYTMGFTSMKGCESVAAHKVFAESHRLQMLRIHTMTFAAEMVERQTFWDRTNIKLIRKSMRSVSLASQRETGVSLRGFVSRPQPT